MLHRRPLTAAFQRLRLPLIAAPMFTISTPDLVLACCRAGIVGTVPALNARSTSELDEWLGRFGSACAAEELPPFGINLICHGTNSRFDADLVAVVAHRTPLVITSVGAPDRALPAVRSYGGLVFADVASIEHAQKASAAGVDGLVLLCAGSGGQTGRLNPFAFVSAVRSFYDGYLAIAGGITDGRQIAALNMLGADLAYAGTAFAIARESAADDSYRAALAHSDADDVFDTDALTGIPVNLLSRSADKLGITKQSRWIPPPGGYDSRDVAWRPGLMSAGHGVGALRRTRDAAEIVEEFMKDYELAQHNCRAAQSLAREG